jgi:flavin-dependent dehydrogenase
MYDIAIIGSGPAGANLARLIGDKYKILLLDKRDLENEIPANPAAKCCGGLLAPDAQKMIARLGLGIPKDILVDPQLFAVRTIDFTNHLERLYQRFYINIDREKFDRWLVSMLPADVDRRYNAVYKDLIEISGGYEIRFFHNGQERCARAKIVVGADGAISKIRNFIGKDLRSPAKYIAIQERYACRDTLPYFMAVFDEDISDFYSWMIQKNDSLLLGAALRPGDNAWGKHALLKTKLTSLGFDFKKKIKTEGAFICRPQKASQLFAGRDGIALIGEAAGAISPSSAEGISYALKSSLYLAQSLDEGLEGFLGRYKQRMREIKLNLFTKNLKSPAMYYPSLRRLVMQSGVQCINK